MKVIIKFSIRLPKYKEDNAGLDYLQKYLKNKSRRTKFKTTLAIMTAAVY